VKAISSQGYTTFFLELLAITTLRKMRKFLKRKLLVIYELLSTMMTCKIMLPALSKSKGWNKWRTVYRRKL